MTSRGARGVLALLALTGCELLGLGDDVIDRETVHCEPGPVARVTFALDAIRIHDGEPWWRVALDGEG